MIAAINQDRARLAEVQDRLIRIDNRRRELAYLNFEGRDKVDPNLYTSWKTSPLGPRHCLRPQEASFPALSP